MSTLLHRLGQFSFRRRWYVLAAWALVLIVLGIGAATLAKPMSNSFTAPGTESQHAIDQLKAKFPESAPGGAQARVVFVAPAGHTVAEPTYAAAVGKVVAQLKAAPLVHSVVDPFQARAVSPDQRAALAQVGYRVQAQELTDTERTALLATAQAGRDAGLTVEFGGDAVSMAPATDATEGLGVLIAAVVLVITLGSLVAAGLSMLTALIGVGVGMAAITAATAFTELNSNTPILALMIGLAVGIDYSLFIVSRYRHELAQGRSPVDAVGLAVGTAGSAVVFAGLTVVIALAGLTVVGVPILAQMGLAAAATVAIAVTIAVTLVPALFGFAGRRILGKRAAKTSTRTPLGERWVGMVIRHRVAVVAAVLAGLAIVALPATKLHLGLPDDSAAAADATQHKAYDLVSTEFGPGANGTLLVVADTAGAADPQAAATRATKELASVPGVAAVTPPVLNSARDTALITVIPTTGPSTTQTEQLVADIRSHAAAIHTSTGAALAVTGFTAMNIDVSATLGDAMLPYLLLVVGLAFLLLMLVFRSVIVPLKATLGFLLSVVATFGAVVAVFQWGWFGLAPPSTIMSMLPILLIGVLFGLAMDYQVFLVTRMREEHVHGAGPDEAVAAGFRHGARVVTAAALIMTSVFAGFILSSQTLIMSIGFALAFGVAVDAFLIRMTLVPAVMSLLGTRAWWLPRWLDRVLPNIDVEGERLTRTLPAAPVPAPADPRTPDPVAP